MRYCIKKLERSFKQRFFLKYIKKCEYNGRNFVFIELIYIKLDKCMAEIHELQREKE